HVERCAGNLDELSVLARRRRGARGALNPDVVRLVVENPAVRHEVWQSVAVHVDELDLGRRLGRVRRESEDEPTSESGSVGLAAFEGHRKAGSAAAAAAGGRLAL